jgi:hypothetical protein
MLTVENENNQEPKKRQSRQSKKVTINQVENKWKKLFASSGVGGFDTSGIAGALTQGYFLNSGAMFVNDPYLLNQRVKQLKTLPTFLDRETIEQALLEPDFNELTLRQATISMFNLTYPLYKMKKLYEGILSYRGYVYPKYVPEEDMNTPRFQSDATFMDRWYKKLAPEKQFRRMVSEILTEGKRAYYVRQSYNTSTKNERCDFVHFQELPSDWIKIVKKSTNSHFVVAMNFAYFWQAGTSLGQFPPIFAEYYNELMSATIMDGNGVIQGIDRAKTPKDVVVEYNSSTMQWFYWKELPSDQAFIFSFDESHAGQYSPFISLLLPSQDLSSYSLLQQQLLSVPLYSILLGEIPMFDEKNSTDYDAYKLSPDATTIFEGKVAGNMPPGTSYVMTPSTNNQMFQFSELPNADKIYLNGLHQVIATAGLTGIESVTDKPSVAQVNISKKVETRFIDQLYAQFMQSCNITLRKMYENGDLKYEWRVNLFGDIFSDDDREKNLLQSLTLGQKQFLPELLALHNQTLSDAVDISNYVDSTGIYKKFEVLVNSFTASNKDIKKSNDNTDVDKKNGRPNADENNIQSDGTEASISAGTNTGDMKDFSINKEYSICPNCGKKVLVNNDCHGFCSDECFEEFKEKLLEE